MIRLMLLVLMVLVLIFLLSCFFYSYYNPYETFDDGLWSNEVIIKQNTEKIQKCTAFDRIRQERAMRALSAWIQFANRYKIKYWLTFGTLLGSVREGGFLPQDSDADVMIKAEDTKELFLLSSTNFSSIYVLNVQPQWQIINIWKRKYARKIGINFIAPNARIVHRKHKNYVDIWPAYELQPENSRVIGNSTKTLSQLNKSYKSISMPMEWTFPLKSCEFSGLKVWCPAMPEKILTVFYGEKALNKSDKVCVNAKWIRNKI